MQKRMKLLLAGAICLSVMIRLSAETASFENTPAEKRREGQVYTTKDGREIYWPKAFVSAEDIYEGKVHKTPMDRRADVTPQFDGFAKERLKPVPAPGVHPRILITPDDVKQIRENIAKGDKAPRNFRMAWDIFKENLKLDPKTGKIKKIDQKTQGGPGWMESWTFTDQCLYALLTDDRELAGKLIPHLLSAVDRGKKYYEAEKAQLHPSAFQNFWAATQSKIKTDIPQPPIRHPWNMQFAQEYDYLYPYMTEEERAKVRDYIAMIVRDRYSHGFELPANKHIINHEIMAWKWLLLPMAIEGEPGFDEGKYSPKKVLEFGMKKFMEVPEWYISPTGVMYENVKGHMPKSVLVAMARRDGGATLAHPHIRNAVDYSSLTSRFLRSVDIAWTRPPIRTRDKREADFWDTGNPESHYWTLGGGMFGGSFDPWVMSYLYPDNKAYDFVFKSCNTAANYDFWDKDYKTWIRPIPDPAISLWCAHDGIKDSKDVPINWNKKELDFKSQLAVCDSERGVAELLSSWNKDALRSRIECRSDSYTGGHESPEFGNFTVSADGVSWAPYQGPYQPVIARNVVTIDGFAGKYPPVPARFVGLYDTPAAGAVVCEYAEALQFTQPGKVWLIEHPELKTEFHKWMAPWSGWDFDRDFQIPFMPHLRWLNEGKASTDFSHWDGQNPWVQYFQRVLPPVKKAWRTIELVRGANPYMLIVDDVQMDDKTHEYRWNFNLQREMVLVSQPDDNTFIIGRGDIDWKRSGSGPGGYANSGLNWQRSPKKGEPLLLVKVLNVNTDSELPAPCFEYSKTWPRIVVPANTVAPDYRVLIYPFKQGEKLPVTTWSEDRSRLTLQIGEQTDQFDFQKADGGRSVFTLTRNGKTVQKLDGVPARPEFADMPPVHRGTRYARHGAELGPPPQTPDPNPVPRKVFTEETEFKFQNIASGQDVRYTLDPPSANNSGAASGSDPTEKSLLYTGPVKISSDTKVKARTYARNWKYGDNASPVVTAEFVKQAPLAPLKEAENKKLSSGLLCSVYEIFTAVWDKQGFADPKLNMMPDLEKYQPILTAATEGFKLPAVIPQQNQRDQYKGFYRFSGYLEVPETGVYTFKIKSMAPISLMIDNKKVIEENGIYHQDLKERFGQIALAKGLHAVNLTICDQAFWRIQQLGSMPLEVAWSNDDGKNFSAIPAAATSDDAAMLAKHSSNPFALKSEELALLPAVKADVENGLLLKIYDRTKLANFADWKRSKGTAAKGLVDIADSKPIAVAAVDDMIEGSSFDGELKVYEGFYNAPFNGLYEFKLDGKGNNALYIQNQVVAANGLPDVNGTGRVKLAQGLHPIRIMLGRSRGGLEVKTPANAEFVPVSFADLAKPVNAEIKTGPENWLVLDSPMPGQDIRKTPLFPTQIDIAPSVKVADDEEKGKVMEFDGSGGISLKDVPAVQDAWTLSFWCKRSDDKDMRFLSPAEEGVSASWWRGQVNAGPPRRAGTGVNLVKEIPKGKWFHVTITADDTVTIYIDGKKRARTYYDPNDGTHTHLLFRRSNGYKLFDNFKGRIADVKFWNAIVPETLK